MANARRGTIALLYRNGDPAGQIIWQGGLQQGAWSYDRGKLEPAVGRDIRKRLRLAIDRHAYLEDKHYRAPAFDLVRGWHGFWGFAQALMEAVPVVGLLIMWNDIVPPSELVIADADLLEPAVMRD